MVPQLLYGSSERSTPCPVVPLRRAKSSRLSQLTEQIRLLLISGRREMQHSKSSRSRSFPIDLPNVSADAQTFVGTDVPIEYLFRYWDERFTLKSFLIDFPEVTSIQALTALRKRAESDIPADSKDGLMGGMPVFEGTRVPVKFLFDLLKQGETLEEFLGQYTTVNRGDAVRILEIASEFMEVATYENSPR